MGAYLLTAIESVRKQTLKKIEIIVVDDASTDEDTVDALVGLGDDVMVLRLIENSGVSAARNAGIAEASADYVVCLDADDYFEETYLQKAKEILDGDAEVCLVSSGVKTFGEQIDGWMQADNPSVIDALVASPIHTASCFRKQVWVDGVKYDESLRGYEDWDLWLNMLKQGGTARVIQEQLFNYRIRMGSKVETDNRESFELVSRIIQKNKSLYRENFEYVIASKHLALALKVNRVRDQALAIKSRNDRIAEAIRKIKSRDLVIKQNQLKFKEIHRDKVLLEKEVKQSRSAILYVRGQKIDSLAQVGKLIRRIFFAIFRRFKDRF